MKADIIKNFIKTVSLDGRIEKLFLEPAPEGAKVAVKNTENTTFLTGILNGLKITEPLPIKDAKAFMAALVWVGGEITLEKVENKLFLSSTTNGKVRSQEIGLVSEEYAKENHLEKIPEFKYEGAVKVEVADLKDMTTSFTALGQKSITIKVVDGKLTFSADGDTDRTLIELPVEYYDCEGYYGVPLTQVVNSIQTKEAQLSLNKENNEYPLKVTVRDENSLVSFIIANITKPGTEIAEPEMETEPVAEEFAKKDEDAKLT